MRHLLSFANRVAIHTMRHLHEVAPAMVVEATRLNIGLVLLMIGCLLIVLSFQVMLSAEAV